MNHTLYSLLFIVSCTLMLWNHMPIIAADMPHLPAEEKKEDSEKRATETLKVMDPNITQEEIREILSQTTEWP